VGVSIVDDLHRNSAVCVLESRGVQARCSGDGGADSACTRLDEASEVRVRPETLGNENPVARDVDERLVVRVGGSAPPVDECGDVRGSESLLDVGRPCHALALSA